MELQYLGHKHVADGDYDVLDMFPDGKNEVAFAVDRKHDNRFTMLPFEGKPCHVDGVQSFVALTNPEGLLVATFDARTNPRALKLFDSTCKPRLKPVTDVVDVRAFEGLILVTTGGGRLYAADPWHDVFHLISEAVTRRGSGALLPGTTPDTQRAIWLLEGDTLVLRDVTGRERRRAGRHVTEIAVTRRSDAMIFSDADGLYRLGHDGSKPKRLGDAGCKLRYETVLRTTGAVDVAMMLAPCKDGRLVTVDPDGTLTALASPVVSYFVRQFLTVEGLPEGWIVYVTQDGDGAPKRYFMAPPSGRGKALELDVPVGLSSILKPVDLSHGEAREWWLTTDEADVRFGTFRPTVGFTTIAHAVRSVGSSPIGTVLLHDYAEGSGTLSLLTGKDLRPLARDVPVDGLLSGPFAQNDTEVLDATDPALQTLPTVDAVVHDLNRDTGTLSLIERGVGLTELARGVPIWSLGSYLTAIRGGRLASPARATAMLSFLEDYDVDAKSGLLSVLTPRGNMTVDENVSSLVPSSDPNRPGVLYVTRKGSTGEVWFVQQ
jgi:hypothetical protein